MYTRLTGFAVFSLFVLMVMPAYANVTSVSLEKSFYTTDEYFSFIGNQDGQEQVFVVVREGGVDYKGMLADINPDAGEFSVIPRPVSDYFKNNGIYNATAFTNNQTEKNGITIQLEFKDDKVFQVLDAILQLNTISDKTVEVEKTISFTASITDS